MYMKLIRRIVRVILLFLWCCFVMIGAGTSLLFICGKWRRISCGACWVRIWSKVAAWIVGIRIKVHGTLPAGQGGLIVSNHLGYLDVLVHGSLFSLRFAPKAEIRKWPFFGQLTALGCPVWIDRKNPRMSAIYAEEFSATMKHGISMLVYPEGTSTDGRHGLLNFKSTPFASALECSSTILPTLLFYRTRGNSDFNAAWFDKTPFGFHVLQILGLRGIDIDIYILPVMPPLPDDTRKSLASRVYEEMDKEYWKIEKSR